MYDKDPTARSIWSPITHPGESCALSRRNDISPEFHYRDQCEAETLTKGDRFLQIHVRKTGEHRKGDDLLHRLQLRGVIDGAAVSIGRHRKAIFDEGQPPADKDHMNKRHVLVAYVLKPVSP